MKTIDADELIAWIDERQNKLLQNYLTNGDFRERDLSLQEISALNKVSEHVRKMAQPQAGQQETHHEND